MTATEEVLIGLGLEPKEVTAYLKLLELGEATPLELSRRTDLKRPTAYLVLQSLEAKGFATRVMGERTMSFVPQNPKKLVLDTETRLNELNEVLPQLESLVHKDAKKPRILVFEGAATLDRAYDDAFTSKGEVLFMSTLRLSKKFFQRTFQKLDQANFSAGFRTRELVDESPESKAYAVQVGGPYRRARLIPRKYLPFETDIGIFGNTTLITSGKEEYFTVGIESPEITRAFRVLFELMWDVSKSAG
jgi:sugar-specific transcriptional regulator TrmB